LRTPERWLENPVRREKALRQWLGKKHKMPGRAASRFPDECLHQKLGLIDLGVRKARFSRAVT